MSNKLNLELVVLCVTLLIETSIRPDLTEMLRPYSQTCKVTLLYTKTRLKSKLFYTFMTAFAGVRMARYFQQPNNAKKPRQHRAFPPLNA